MRTLDQFLKCVHKLIVNLCPISVKGKVKFFYELFNEYIEENFFQKLPNNLYNFWVYQNNNKLQKESKCNICGQANERVNQTPSEYHKLAQKEYKHYMPAILISVNRTSICHFHSNVNKTYAYRLDFSVNRT